MQMALHGAAMQSALSHSLMFKFCLTCPYEKLNSRKLISSCHRRETVVNPRIRNACYLNFRRNFHLVRIFLDYNPTGLCAQFLIENQLLFYHELSPPV